MKKSDYAILILIIGISLLVAYLLASSIFGDSSSQPVEIKTAQRITTQVEEPNPEIFNDQAINPSVEIKIGDSADKSPFGG